MKRIRIDITNKKFNKLTVLEYSHTNKQGRACWKCECDCPNKTIVIVSRTNLVNGNTKSCGCLKYESRYEDLTGQKFGKLIVIKKSEKRTNSGKIKWTCECSCIKRTILDVIGATLKRGTTRSCGCVKIGTNTKNLIGKIFNKLTVISLSHYDKHNKAHWICQCECGKTSTPSTSSLTHKTNPVKSCGCYKNSPKKEKHGNWNLDREQVKLNKKTRTLCNRILNRVLNYTGKNKNKRTHEMLGYTQDELLEHLGITSIKDFEGMEVDHIFPIVAFTRHGISDARIINSLDNLQLLTVEEHKGKQDKYDKGEFYKYLESHKIYI